jgi:hypothetical protein
VTAQLELDASVVECGSVVTGNVTWSPGGRRGPSRLVLRYRTEGRGNKESKVVARCFVGPGKTGQARFELAVPASGPVSYDGQLLRLIWEVVLDPLTSGATVDLTVVPSGWLRLAPEVAGWPHG